MKRPEWDGEVYCIASGPSLTPEDCETVRTRQRPTLVTNTTFRLCAWADLLFGFDGMWWKTHIDEVRRVFSGRMVSMSPWVPNIGVETLHGCGWFHGFGDSGSSAIGLAIAGGASRIVMLGYDCQRTGGRNHWHGDHPKGLSNCKSMPTWPKRFENLACFAREQGVEVVNASRETALTCFPRIEL